jgi:hypothetical protein
VTLAGDERVPPRAVAAAMVLVAVILLAVATRSPVGSVTLPDVVGLSPGEAVEAVEAVGLVPRLVFSCSPGAGPQVDSVYSLRKNLWWGLETELAGPEGITDAGRSVAESETVYLRVPDATRCGRS